MSGSTFKNTIEKVLNQHFTADIKILAYNSVGGGSINDAYKVETDSGIFFIKTNSNSRFPGMFEKEAKGIEILKQANCINVPEVICVNAINGQAFLILKFIENGTKEKDFWDLFAKQLADLHKITASQFGLEHDNYIGSLVQYNERKSSWAEFFIEQRLEIQLKMAFNGGFFDKSIIQHFQNFYKRIEGIFPNEPPALVHGDLWRGNYMVGPNSTPYIVDPAVYYGHREMDLAMSMLFGGFSDQFYSSYHKYFPLENAWDKRMEYCNLYPLLVHVNLFGGSYASSVKSIIKSF